MAGDERLVRKLLSNYAEVFLRASSITATTTAGTPTTTTCAHIDEGIQSTNARQQQHPAPACVDMTRVRRSDLRREINSLLRTVCEQPLSQKSDLWKWFCETYIDQTRADRNVLERDDSKHRLSSIVSSSSPPKKKSPKNQRNDTLPHTSGDDGCHRHVAHYKNARFSPY
jgi:hypothetical protein